MKTGPLMAAPQAGTPAGPQVVIEQARAHARRRRRRTALAALIAAAAIGGGLAGAAAWPGSRPAAPSGSSGPAPLAAHTGGITGYIDPCEAIAPPKAARLPYAAGTVTALRGKVTWKPDGPGTWRLQLPATAAARQHVGQNQKYHFDLPAGQYVLAARYDTGNVISSVAVSITAGRILHRDLPNVCK